jgi:hypothetical protein
MSKEQEEAIEKLMLDLIPHFIMFIKISQEVSLIKTDIPNAVQKDKEHGAFNCLEQIKKLLIDHYDKAEVKS